MTKMDRIAVANRVPGGAHPASSGRIRAVARRARGLLRSILGQMVLAIVLFTGGGVYMFAIRPILLIPPLEQPDPLDMTVSAVNQRLQGILLDLNDTSGTFANPRTDPLIRDVARQNPDFHYYLRRGDRVSGTGGPHYFKAIGLDRIERARAGLDDPSLCIQMQRPMRDARGSGYLSYGNCGTASYMEFGGVRAAVPVPLVTPMQAYMSWLWNYSRGFLLPSLGVFLLVVAIMLVNVIRIRRVARLTRGLGTDPPAHRSLPEAGLPTEVLPLVRAVNHMIEEADQAQRRRRFFLSAAAHELRTPLTVLRTRLEIMDDGELKAKLIRDLSRLTTLSNDLLTLMSIDARSRPVEPIDLSGCCLNVLDEMEEIATARGVTFRFVAPEDGPLVAGHAALLEVAITNLIDNALSFAPAGTDVIVTVDEDGELQVRDFGLGFHMDNADALFEPFVRSNARRVGHGLGLAIVKAVAELHGAGVAARNAANGGAAVSILFPVRAGASLRTA